MIESGGIPLVPSREARKSSLSARGGERFNPYSSLNTGRVYGFVPMSIMLKLVKLSLLPFEKEFWPADVMLGGDMITPRSPFWGP
jgi:hypothetical protein